MLSRHAALLLIDIQNDFCPGGALAVPGGDTVVTIANRLMPNFTVVVASQDWHPENHLSFASQHPNCSIGDFVDLNGRPQILWPDHCIAHTNGADFHRYLADENITKIIKKGTSREIDSYSAFYDNHRLKSTGLTAWLNEKNITHLYVMGLATDYCVKFSCLDAVADGFSVTLVTDGCCGINLSDNDIENAILEMRQKGVIMRTSQEILLD